MEFTGGDATMLPTLMQIGENDEVNQERRQKQAKAKAFLTIVDSNFTGDFT